MVKRVWHDYATRSVRTICLLSFKCGDLLAQKRRLQHRERNNDWQEPIWRKHSLHEICVERRIIVKHKIKDNQDLKILENYGYHENAPHNYLKYLIDKEYYLDCIQIDLQTRIITRHIKELYEPEIQCKKVAQSLIQDLLDADLCETV